MTRTYSHSLTQDTANVSTSSHFTSVSTHQQPIPEILIPPLVSSTSGLIQVLDFNPTEGECGVPITVRTRITSNRLPAVCTRLVFGQRAVATTVRELPTVGPGAWQLVASAPPLDAQSLDQKIPISVQLLDMNNQVLDAVIFGEFTYWISGLQKPFTFSSPMITPPVPPLAMKRSASPRHPTAPKPIHINNSADERHTSSENDGPLPGRKSQIHRRTRAHSSASRMEDNLTPVLQLLTPLETMSRDWDDTEIKQGRRLVKFHRLQQGRDLLVSCEPITQADYCEVDTVISCIYRKESDECFVTSVDIIYLLEKLTNDEFPVEEKNRIRRNLEGLHPITVSKHKPGFERFFQSIMSFPDPKPRNIEKDLKVFGWESLGPALEKILSKYTIVNPSPASQASTPIEPVLVHALDSERCYFSINGQKFWRAYTDPTLMAKVESPLPSPFPERFDLLDCSSNPSPTLIASPGYWPSDLAIDGSPLPLPENCTQEEEPFEDLASAYTHVYEP